MNDGNGCYGNATRMFSNSEQVEKDMYNKYRNPSMKISDYIHYLSLMHDIHNNTEELIYPMLSGIITDLNERKKKHLIEEDLLYLNHNKSASIDVFDSANLTVPFALGILYVVQMHNQ